jgi:hypothetical protein
MNYIRVRNWEKFQHYKHRSPPWIKLHTELLDNYEFACLQDASKLLALCIWMIAARSDNKIPADPGWIQKRANLSGKVDLAPLLQAGFIEEIQGLPSPEQPASTMLATRKQSADSEKSRDREETEAECASARAVPGLDLGSWDKWVTYRRKIGKPLKPVSLVDAAREMAKHGDQQAAVVQHSIGNQYQGLIPPKVNGSHPAIKPAKPPPPTPEQITAAQREAADANRREIEKKLGGVFR